MLHWRSLFTLFTLLVFERWFVPSSNVMLRTAISSGLSGVLPAAVLSDCPLKVRPVQRNGWFQRHPGFAETCEIACFGSLIPAAPAEAKRTIPNTNKNRRDLSGIFLGAVCDCVWTLPDRSVSVIGVTSGTARLSLLDKRKPAIGFFGKQFRKALHLY